MNYLTTEKSISLIDLNVFVKWRYRHILIPAFLSFVISAVLLIYYFKKSVILRTEFVDLMVSFCLGSSALVFGALNVVNTQKNMVLSQSLGRIDRVKDRLEQKLEFYSPLMYAVNQQKLFRPDKWFEYLDSEYSLFSKYNMYAEADLKDVLNEYIQNYSAKKYDQEDIQEWEKIQKIVSDTINSDFNKILDFYNLHTRIDESILKAQAIEKRTMNKH